MSASGQETSAQDTQPSPPLPAKLRYQLQQKRAREEAEGSSAHQDAAGPAPAPADSSSAKPEPLHGSDEWLARALGQDTREPSGKRTELVTSKILGIARPHKPRIGPQYQAVIPDLQPSLPPRPNAKALLGFFAQPVVGSKTVDAAGTATQQGTEPDAPGRTEAP